MSGFKANAFLLKSILDDIDDGKLQLPDFQRGWVWDDTRIKDLLISIARGFPIGAVMTLDAAGDVKFESRLIEGVKLNGNASQEQYLLDGQQRLTSLYQALRYNGPVETRDRPGGRKVSKRWYFIDISKAIDPTVDRDEIIVSVPEDRVIRSNFGRDIVRSLSEQDDQFQHHMIPTEQVMDGMAWGFSYAQYWNDRGGHPKGDPFSFFTEFKNVVLDNFGEYQLPVINLGKETSKEAVCTVFEKVNTGGVTLNVFELVTASFAAEGFRLREDWDARRGRLHAAFGVLQGIDGDQFLQAVTLLATQERRRNFTADSVPPTQAPGIDCRRASILDLKLSEYQSWADRVEGGFKAAARFLNSQFVFTRGNVPYNTQLVPLAALYVELGNELDPARAREQLEQWFWCGVLGEVYGGSVETQFANDLVQVGNRVRGGSEPALVGQATFAPERLLSLRTRNSAAYKGLYALQMKSGAADWSSAESLTLADFHSKPIEIHHVFPKHWCEHVAKPAIPRRLYDSIINKTPIDAFTNRIIGGRSPSRYLPLLRRRGIEKEMLERVLRAHWIEPIHLEEDDFRSCFVGRGQAMLDLITQTMGKPRTDGYQVFHDALSSAQLIAEDDDDEEVEHDEIGESVYGDDGSLDAR